MKVVNQTPTPGRRKSMDTITVLNYTELYQQFIAAHPEEAINRHCEMFVIVCNGNIVESIRRCLN